MADKSGVVLLNGSNYATWKIQVKMALIKYGGWGFVTDNEPEPAEGDYVAWRKFNERKDKALATIVLAVDPSPRCRKNWPINSRRKAAQKSWP